MVIRLALRPEPLTSRGAMAIERRIWPEFGHVESATSTIQPAQSTSSCPSKRFLARIEDP